MSSQRKFERYPARLEIGLISNDGHIVMSESSDISENGMFLTVPEDSISKLEVSGMIIGRGEDLRVSLSNHRKTIEFVILCTIAHVSVDDQGDYLIGLQFEDKRTTLKDFIHTLLKTFN